MMGLSGELFNNAMRKHSEVTAPPLQYPPSSPIMGSLQSVYSWSPYFCEWLGNTANITFCVLVIPGLSLRRPCIPNTLYALSPSAVSAFVDSFGMRRSVLITIAALNLNAGLRLLPVTGRDYEGASLVSMVFNGIAGAYREVLLISRAACIGCNRAVSPLLQALLRRWPHPCSAFFGSR